MIMVSRFMTMVVVTVAVSLFFQIINWVGNRCSTERRRSSVYSALNDRDRDILLYYYQREIYDNTTDNPERETMSTEIQKRWLTIGIPTIQRRDGSYFPSMLASLLNSTLDSQLHKIYLVVFLADFNKTEWKNDMETQLNRNYSKYFDTGTLKVVRAPETFYSSFNGSSAENEYMFWRIKQNYDYAYIMQYCARLSDYYMQMEDDVITAEGYLNSITDFMKKQTDDKWVCLEFSELGYIGKLYHSRDLRHLVQMFLMFNETQPVDYTYIYYNILSGQMQRLIRKPTLFQHIGYYSSLSDKIQPLKDTYFHLPSKKYNGDNPEAVIYTTFAVYPDFPPEHAYINVSGFFWSSSSAREGDIFTIVFKTPQLVDKVLVETGTEEHPTDIIEVGVVEASTVMSDIKRPPYCTDFVVVGQFDKGVANITDMRSTMGVFKTKCLQITVTKDQIAWVIIREITVWVRK